VSSKDQPERPAHPLSRLDGEQLTEALRVVTEAVSELGKVFGEQMAEAAAVNRMGAAYAAHRAWLLGKDEEAATEQARRLEAAMSRLTDDDRRALRSFAGWAIRH
jgi:hypothetical protein